MTRHYFDVDVAKACGINAAIVFENLKFWINHNKSKNKNFRDGKHWMYSTQKELSEQFEYLSVKQVRTALEKLESAGYIIKGNYNRHGYDRTAWYAFGESVEEVVIEETQQENNAPQPAEKPVEPIVVDEPITKAPKTEAPHRGANKGQKRKNYYGQNQKPKRANPEPVWLYATAPQGTAIQDIKEVDKKENLIMKMRRLAAECGAVCTV